MKTKNSSMTLEFSKTRKGQVGVVHFFDAMVGRPLAPTSSHCGGITKDGEEGHTVPLAAKCVCEGGSDGPR